MLKLKRVELQGFKSFCDRTEMRFNGAGVACIVGPNGCGKSNLADAISWVLGEQSAKSLRGAHMADVIFAGSKDRKPLGLAQVTMALVDPGDHVFKNGHPNGNGSNGQGNGNGQANGNGTASGNGKTKPEEIIITRRLFRSGESEYLIDGKAARLRDIQDIFMGTGLGPESYAIIEQGRIGQILSSKPQDRRAVIEEAAGVSKFKARKRLAEARLEGARQNLARVFDILEEVGRQANSLKRQAAKARRYEELKTEMVAQLRRSLIGRFSLLERDAAKVALDLNLANAEYQGLTTQVAEKEQEHQTIQESCYATETELTEARKRLAELRVEDERTRGRLEYQAKQIATIEQRLAQGETDSQEIEKRLAVQQQEYGAAGDRLWQLEADTDAASRRLAEKTEERDQVQGRLRAREASMESSRQQVLRLLGEASTLKNQLAQIDEYLAGIDRDTTRCRREEAAAGAERERLEKLKAELGERMAARQLQLESLADRRRTVEEELSVKRARAAEARKRLEECREEFSRLKARKDSLEEILSHRAYTTESVKRLFTAIERGQAQDLKPAGVLADFVDVDPSYEKAAEEFLHDELEYVVVNSWTQADGGIDLMRTGLDGRATFLVHPNGHTPLPASPEPAIGPETGILCRLRDVLKLTNGLTHAPADLLPRLARCFIAEDRAAAQRLAAQYPDLYFLLPDGVCYHGHAVSGGRKTGAGPLALKRELRELIGQVRARETELSQTAALADDLDRDITALGEDLESLRAEQQREEKEALALDHEMRKLAEEFARANSRLSVARLDLERLGREAGRSQEQRERNLLLVEDKEAARRAQEEALAMAREEMEEMQEEFARIGEEHSVLRVELAGLEERRRSEKAALARLEAQLREVGNRRENLAAEMERLGVERARLLADNIELDARAGELSERLESAAAEVNGLAEREQELRLRLAGAEETLKALRVDAEAAHEKRSQIELELVKKQAELKFLDETSRKELGQSLEELAAGQETAPDEIGLAEAEGKYNELKARIEALGPVNPQALEEYRETQQRYDFLNEQRQDLLDSIRDTEKAIQDIDVESRKRFSVAFETINNHFRELFKTLFGGGIAEMRLTDEVNVIESGIEIIASPPGKRLQNVLLLSGGEKALTALALLMATFKYQPSPFCILDEVDAPLDEPNIQRLTRLLKEMSGQTQFIVITHAKRTMESAQVLYGVTMQEPGVSKLVSVKFEPLPAPPLAGPEMASAAVM